jgi:hypothetical protein
VHLPDRGGRHRRVAKSGKACTPLGPKVLGEDALQLAAWHRVGAGAHALQRGLELGRQHVLLDADHLPQLQRCAAHAAQRVGQALCAAARHKSRRRRRRARGGATAQAARGRLARRAEHQPREAKSKAREKGLEGTLRSRPRKGSEVAAAEGGGASSGRALNPCCS